MERRTFLAISGAALTGPAHAVTADSRPDTAPAKPVDTSAVITPAITKAIAATVDAVRRLDDAEGGDRSTLPHAHREFMVVAGYVRANRFANAATRTRAINLWARAARPNGRMDGDGRRAARQPNLELSRVCAGQGSFRTSGT